MTVFMMKMPTETLTVVVGHVTVGPVLRPRSLMSLRPHVIQRDLVVQHT